MWTYLFTYHSPYALSYSFLKEYILKYGGAPKCPDINFESFSRYIIAKIILNFHFDRERQLLERLFFREPVMKTAFRPLIVFFVKELTSTSQKVLLERYY